MFFTSATAPQWELLLGAQEHGEIDHVCKNEPNRGLDGRNGGGRAVVKSGDAAC
jgi:hypothetical protein